MKASETINPVEYSVEEAKFLIKYLGEPSEVAELDGFPTGVNPNAVLPCLDRIYRLIKQTEARNFKWAGVQAVKDGFQVYVTQFERWQSDNRRGAPKYPSQYVWDDSGRGHKGAVGADGNVSTYFDETGQRKQFLIDLIPDGLEHYVPAWVRPAEKRPVPKLIEDSDKGTIACPVCHFTQNYDVDTRSTYNLARGRMSKHLLQSRKNPDMHREVYTQEFASGGTETR